MKRVLSLVLALVLVLGSVPMVFAADATGGDKLQEAGFISGDQDGNLMEEDALTRAQSMVLVAQLNGVFEEAKSYSIPGSFSDVDYENDWFAPYVAYAEMAGWTAGYPDGTFKPAGNVSEQELCAIMMNALDYDVVWETVIDDAAEIGITVTAADATALTRGESFETMWTVVSEVPKNGSDVPLGVELGKLEPTEPEVKPLEGAVIDEVVAVGNTVVEVTFEEDVDAAAAAMTDNYMITEKGDTSVVIEVVSVVVADTDRVLLTTDEMDGNEAYTLTVAEDSKNFVGVKASTAKPKVTAVKGTDTNEIEVTFDRALDYTAATDVDNYSVNKDGVVVAAELNGDNDVVTLTCEGVDVRTTYKLTVQGVASVDGVEMTKTTKSFTGRPDTKAPTISRIEPKTNTMFYIYFNDDHGVDKEMIEDVSNWEIDKDLEVVAIEADKTDDSDYYDYAKVETSSQKSSTKYTVTISNLTDGSTSKNVATKDIDKTFYGKREDNTAPNVNTTPSERKANDKIVLQFSDASALDEASLLDPSNYEIDNDVEVLSVEWDDDDKDKYTPEGQRVVITTTEQDYPKSYKMTISDISDEFGNTMDKDKYVRWSSLEIQDSAPYVKSVDVPNDDTVEITFSHGVDEATAEDATNYEIEDLGYPTKAEVKSGTDSKVVTLTVPTGDAGKTYEITMNGIEDYYGNVVDDLVAKYTAVSSEIDTTDFEVTGAYAVNKSEIRVTFNKELTMPEKAELKLEKKSGTGSATMTAEFVAESDDEYIFKLDTAFDDDISVYNITDIVKDGTTTTITDKFGITMLTGENSGLDNIDIFATEAEPELATVDYIDQVHSKKIAVYFDQEMVVADGATYASVSGNINFTNIYVDSDDSHIVYFETAQRITESTDLKVNMGDKNPGVTTVGGAACEKKVIEVTTITFDATPVVTGVEAIYNDTIEVTFDQEIEYPGSSYMVKDSEGDDFNRATILTVDGDVVTAKFASGKTLKGGEVYTIEVVGARTHGGKTVDKEEFDFDGTSVAQSEYVTGVEVVGPNTAIVYATANVSFDDMNLTASNTTGTAFTIKAGADSKEVTIETDNALLVGVTYTIDTNLGDYTFEGLTEDGGIAAIEVDTDLDPEVEVLQTQLTYGDMVDKDVVKVQGESGDLTYTLDSDDAFVDMTSAAAKGEKAFVEVKRAGRVIYADYITVQ